MPDTNKFCQTLLDTLKIVVPAHINNNKVQITANNGISLFKLTKDSIELPLPFLKERLFSFPSPLSDTFVETEQLCNFMDKLKSRIVRLNHVGVCHFAQSQMEEKARIIAETQKTKLHLYEEPSNDAGLWLFLGDVSTWDNPLLEIIPIQDRSDKWVDYWLPHFQIDLDTTINTEDIEKAIRESFCDKVIPFRSVVIDGVTYAVRARLGIISGVNINIDIATSARKVEFTRKHILKQLV